jgi:putative transposase
MGAYVELYLHAVWATWKRLPLITPEIRPRVYASLAHHVQSLGGDVIAIGGIEDHVHVLARCPAAVSVADYVGKLKGGSSYFVTQILRHPEFFKWQGGYGAFSLSRRGIPAVRGYVLNQEQHHRAGTLLAKLERTGDE